jgi:hypothetical protein
MRWFKAFRFVVATGRAGLHHLPRTGVNLLWARDDGPSECERLRRGSECSGGDRWRSIVGELTAPLFTAILLLVALERSR